MDCEDLKMPKTNRDDFNKDTVLRAAQRTAFRCSFCRVPTIGPSRESNNAVSNIGVAAHICAAAPGGKRYDPNMTKQQRKSIDNCIWMCQVHAHLIDTDEITYSVSMLKEMKAKAEADAEKAIADVNLYTNNYKKQQDDVSALDVLFLSMLKQGNFDLLRNTLECYNRTVSSVYDELVLRYKTICDIYCDTSMIPIHFEKYLKLQNHNGADQLLEIAISFNQVEVVEKLLPLSGNAESKKLAQMLIDKKLEDALIGSREAVEPFEVSKEKCDLINSYVIHRAIDRNIYRMQSVDGDDAKLTSDDLYCRLLYAAFRLVRKIVYENASILSTPEDEDFWELKQHMDVIKQLDATLQDFLWESVLQFTLPDPEQFYALIEKLPLYVQDMPLIARVRWLFQILNETVSVNVDKLLEYSDSHNNYRLLSMYLWQIPENDRYEFIKDHLYLCKKSSRILQMILEYEEKYDLHTIQLTDYDSFFKNDFLYTCLKYKNLSDESAKKETVEWLITHQDLLLTEDLHLYLDILALESKYDLLIELSTHNLHNEHLFHIAHLLSKNTEETYTKKALQIYETLEEKGWRHQNLFFNIAIVSANAGKFEKAKKYLKKEYDTYGSQIALFHLLRLRITTTDVCEDEYLHKAKSIVSSDFQHIVAASYDKLRNHHEAKLYLLRTLLIDDTESCVGALFPLYQDGEKEEDPEYVQKECVCFLESSEEIVNVAIHSDEVLKGIKPNNFANCTHFSAGDPTIASLMYHQKEDVVEYDGKEYKLIDIKSTTSFFASYALQYIITKGEGVQTIRGSTPEEAMANITTCLMETKSHTDNILNAYNSSEVRYPVSVLSSLLGRGCIEICELLALGNSERLRNNPNIPTEDDSITYILSFDAIINLALAGQESLLCKCNNIVCSRQVKNHLLSEINKITDDLNSRSSKGTMHLVNDRAIFSERTLETKRNRYTFLASIKNIVNSLQEVEAFDFEPPNSDMDNWFTEGKMDIESGTLALLQNTTNAVLITDDQFLYAVTSMLGCKSVGICGFLTGICEDGKKLIEISKKLRSINFANYIPLFLFNKILERIDNAKTPQECDSVTEDLTEWLLSDREEEEATDYHREVVLQLYREYTQQIGYVLPMEYGLTQIAIHHFKMLNPEYIKQLVEDFAKNIVVTVETEPKEKDESDS